MREILFRGIDAGTQEWVYGYYCERPSPFHIGKEYSIFDDKTISRYTILPETVGQYTGLTDKNGKKIFEGDILGVLDYYRKEQIEGVVKYGVFNCSCCDGVFGWYIDRGDIRLCEEKDLYVIGNIHDNPDLLMKGE